LRAIIRAVPILFKITIKEEVLGGCKKSKTTAVKKQEVFIHVFKVG
jgi:hypothetical protein